MKRNFIRQAALATVAAFMLAAMITSAVSSAAAQDATSEASNDAAAYCTEQGGTVVTRYPALNTSAPESAVKLAGAKDFCEFKDKDGGLASLPTEVLAADGPTLAALAYLSAPELKSTSTANPSYLYCAQLNGAINFGLGGESGWVNSADAKDVINPCVFADGSMIDAWTLFYKSGGTARGADLTAHFRWKADGKSKALMDIFKSQ